MKQRLFWLCVFSLIPAAVGCARIDRLYDSQYFHKSNPSENVAIVFCQPNLHIDMIDNHSMKSITNAAEVEPGRHEISVEYRRHDYGYYGEPDIYSKNTLRLALNAVPGHIYEIRHDVPEQVIEATTKFGYLTSWNAWIQDVTSQPEAGKYLSYLK